MLIKIRSCDAIGPSDCKINLKQGAHIHQPTVWAVPHACAQPSHITRAVAAMDSCFALIGAHQLGIAVGSMNEENPRVSKTLLRDCSRFDCHHNWRWIPSGSVGIFESVVNGPFKLVSLIEEEIRCLTWTRVVFNTENTVQSLIFNVTSLHMYNSHYFT